LNHIKIVSLYDIEKISIIGNSIIDEFEKQKKDKRGGDYPLSGDIQKASCNINKSFLEFKMEWLSQIEKSTDKMVKENIIVK
jgi:hypothetical protein